MHREKVKNLILLVLVMISIYLSSVLWLDISLDFTRLEKDDEPLESIYLWDKVRPVRVIIDQQYRHNVYDLSVIEPVWEAYREVLVNLLRAAYDENDIQVQNMDGNGIIIHFESPLSMEIMTQGLGVTNNRLTNRIEKLSWMGFDPDARLFYLNDGQSTYQVPHTFDDMSMVLLYNEMKDFAKSHQNQRLFLSEALAEIPYSKEVLVLSPVFIRSEIDIEDQDAINEIAKAYFGDRFDYARRMVDSFRTISFIYRNEKVLRLYEEGLLELFDAIESTQGETSLYRSLMVALNFIENFLGFPEQGYLSRVESILQDGKYGYRFIFSYQFLDLPIVFSQVREEKAMQIEVLDGRVVYYQRFIRVFDENIEQEMQTAHVLSPQLILDYNIDFMTDLYLEDANHQLLTFDEAKNKILSSINEVYLAYFDPSRRSRDQLIRSVWVFRTNDRKYIFNGITGAIIEEQIIEEGVAHGLE